MIWWKIYFWIYAVLGFISSFVIVSESPNLIDWIAFVIEIMVVVALFLYAYQKTVDPKKWRIFFWITAVFWLINFIYEFVLSESFRTMYPILEGNVTKDTSIGWAWASYLFIIPALYALYRLSSQSTKQSSKK